MNKAAQLSEGHKQRKRKLTEEERKAEGRELGKKLLDITKLIPNADDPRTVARHLAKKFSESRLQGVWLIHNAIMRHKDQRFVGQMLIALGEYLVTGKQRDDDLEVELADIVARHRGRSRPTTPYVMRELRKRRPESFHTKGKIRLRVKRLWDRMQRADPEPPL